MAQVTFLGNPLNLVGTLPAVDAAAPDFTLTDKELKPKTLADYKDKVLVIATVPSLDTPVCDTEIRRFNKEAAALGSNVAIICVSRDLPFAQARWCGAAGIEAVETLSDYRDGSFGRAYGVYIKELDLLARSIVVVKDGKVRYTQLVAEVATEPDYDAALAAVRALV